MEEVFLERTEFSDYEDFYKNYKIKIPENFNFGYDVMDVLAKNNPDGRALVWTNDEGDYYEISFAKMKELSDAAASYYMELGVKRGDFVMLVLQRRYEFWISIVALCKIGAVAIPASHMLTREDYEYRFNAVNIKMILCVNDEDVMDHIDEAAKVSPNLKVRACVNSFGVDRPIENLRNGWVNFTEGRKNAKPFPVLPRNQVSSNEDLMLGYFTSGTTSHPKLAVHNFLYPLGHITTAKYWQHVKKGGLHLTVADTGWAKTSWGRLFGQWICETALFVYDYHARFKPTDLLVQCEKYKVTTFCAPPTIYRFLIQEDLSGYDLSSITHCSTAGEPLSEEVYNKWLEATGHKITEGFGQSETTVCLFNFDSEKIKPGSIGKPSPYYHVELLNAEGHPVQDGQVGELCFKLDEGRFPGLVVEYYGEPDKTAAAFHDGYYDTGDMAWRDEDGYYWFTGRSDDVIKCSGYRIGTFEVESVLMQHPAVVECAVTGAPDPIRGQVVKATIVLAKSYAPGNDILKKEIQQFVKETTAPYKYPRIVEFVDELPKTTSGKIMRKEIRKQDEAK
ncbi:MAG: AMP-binding protein [Treponemataceae bacterium]|nr:AMP-binding protein [Spirochaetales bacterium]MDY6030439.1 AMP-binding protein [Treponemataceae bacterium]